MLAKIKKFPFQKYIVYISFLAVLLVFSILLRNKGFLTYSNMMNILRQTAMISVAAIGMTFCISAGQIDLSTAGVVSLSALVTASFLKVSGWVPAVIAGLAVGLLCGLLNGIILAKVKIPSFIITLGTNTVFCGLSRMITDLEAVPITNKEFNAIFGSGNLFGVIPSLLVWTVVCMLIGHIIYKKTPLGRAILGVGGNESCTKFSGIKTEKIKCISMIICAIAASFAGILYAGRLNGARYTLGENDSMNVIAAVVIGGTAFSGGKGTVIGTIIGSIVIGMLNNGLLLMGLDVSEQMIARGIIIILAVSLSLRETASN